MLDLCGRGCVLEWLARYRRLLFVLYVDFVTFSLFSQDLFENEMAYVILRRLTNQCRDNTIVHDAFWNTYFPFFTLVSGPAPPSAGLEVLLQWSTATAHFFLTHNHEAHSSLQLTAAGHVGSEPSRRSPPAPHQFSQRKQLTQRANAARNPPAWLRLSSPPPRDCSNSP